MPEFPSYLRIIFQYKSIILFIAFLIISFHIISNPMIEKAVIGFCERFSYFTAFIAGLLYASFVTIPLSIVLIYDVARFLHPVMIGIIGGVGSMLADVLVFQFFKLSIIPEIKLLATTLKERSGRARRLFEYVKLSESMRKNALWIQKFAPLIAAFIISSPLPDELAIFFLAAVEYDMRKLMVLTFVLNSIGIVSIASISLLL
ncbi:MAG: hypothetical protein QW507_00525 [Candidatus Nanoarchaeia archaeon]|nr:hypothetical protein [Candidatus Haiyanarchaeum thermophilum]MCW1302935.1 hypothetical protein [Candidatus Haiyanarchaeum thermophilum]MCW1303612.1 hypothetical protein [Candidatus Haiyanarchaeum thermophilum]MCW1306294.1 hypothetical protein [Candidatus Haiyanarchaeum thermophilum]MCW1307196.1 hypothetical protein [Candidatus Haiyanarchaeum thermophilum]